MPSTTWATPASKHPPDLLYLALVEEGGGISVDFLFHIGWGQAVVLKCLARMGIVVSGINFG
jgi:hypothetical protein